jgi:hypothetical protein
MVFELEINTPNFLRQPNTSGTFASYYHLGIMHYHLGIVHPTQGQTISVKPRR